MIKALASIHETARKRSYRSPRIPRAGKRGLGLADAMLAVIVLGVLGTTGWQVASDWIDRRLLANEGRALATLARAGRLWVEGDSSRAPTGGTPAPVDVSDLVTAGLRGPGDPEQTPARRIMTLWLREEAPDRILVLARARGDAPHANRHTPDAIDGVPGLGVVVNRGGVLQLAGPDVTLDFTDLNNEDPTFAQVGDLFALSHVFVNDCGPYLSREDENCATMSVPLNMGNQALTNVGQLEANTLEVNEITGVATLTDPLTVTEDIEVEGNVVAEGNITVENDFTAGAIQTDQIFATEGDFTRLTVDDLIANTCDGDGCP